MLSDFLKKNIKSQAGFIQANGYGYGQVEPNHLSGQATKEVYEFQGVNIIQNTILLFWSNYYLQTKEFIH